MHSAERKEIRNVAFMGLSVVSVGEIAAHFLEISPYILGITRGFGIAAFGLMLLKLFKSKNTN